jgi:hypothetical protein
MHLLKEKEVKEEETAIGFLGKTSSQLLPNTVIVWGFEKP